eukprot:365910-Chlamydomonas_euryale.AAC.8
MPDAVCGGRSGKSAALARRWEKRIRAWVLRLPQCRRRAWVAPGIPPLVVPSAWIGQLQGIPPLVVPSAWIGRLQGIPPLVVPSAWIGRLQGIPALHSHRSTDACRPVHDLAAVSHAPRHRRHVGVYLQHVATERALSCVCVEMPGRRAASPGSSNQVRLFG